MKLKSVIAAILTYTACVFCFCLFASCANAVSSDPLRIFVSIAPEKWLVEQLGGDLVEVGVLLDKGQEPHVYQPSPEKLTALFRSSLYFTTGMEFEKKISQKIKSSAGVKIVDVTGGIKRIPMSRPEQDHHKKKEEHTAQSLHHHDGLDPHIWLNPLNLRQMASNMVTAMIAADPNSANAYRRNQQGVRKNLERLHQELSKQLAPFQGMAFFVFHPAFGYFAHAYGLRQESVAIEGKSPTPKQLYALVKRARADKVKVLFVQPQFDRKTAETVARAIGGKIVELDPLAEDAEKNLRLMTQRIRCSLADQQAVQQAAGF